MVVLLSPVEGLQIKLGPPETESCAESPQKIVVAVAVTEGVPPPVKTATMLSGALKAMVTAVSVVLGAGVWAWNSQ